MWLRVAVLCLSVCVCGDCAAEFVVVVFACDYQCVCVCVGHRVLCGCVSVAIVFVCVCVLLG